MADWTIARGGAELLGRVGPLWERLSEHHAQVSAFHREHRTSFEQRAPALQRKAAEGALLVDLVVVVPGGEDAGYCLTSAVDGVGEVESLFVAEPLRGSGLGGELVSRALAWLNERGVDRCIVGVAAGNEAALPLYERHGFARRATILERRTP